MFGTSGVLTAGIGLLLCCATILPYAIRYRAAEKRARNKLRKTAGTEMNVAPAMHPRFDTLRCIGCGSCVRACPEGDVLGLIEGRASLIHASKCVGHAVCAERCPVSAISLVVGSPGRSSELPAVDENYQTNVPGMYIVGELGGIGLIKNAVNQGVRAVEHIAATLPRVSPSENQLDLAIVGAGPAGMTAALAARKHGLRFVVLEQGDIGGAILHYPRRKIVLTSPVELPLHGRLKFSETTKESLLETWNSILEKTPLPINCDEKVVEISRDDRGFIVKTAKQDYSARRVVLALGRRGTPRKLGVPGEHLSKVMYRLIEAETYQGLDLLIVGGGDSAVEAAAALAEQPSNRVTLSYRKGVFSRIKERNEKRLEEAVRGGRLSVVLQSNVDEIRESSVLLHETDAVRELPNDYVFVFAGGELPYDLLRRAGIELRAC